MTTPEPLSAARSTSVYGTKAVNLLKLRDAGLSVPETWLLQCHRVDAVLRTAGHTVGAAFFEGFDLPRHGIVVRSSFSAEDASPNFSNAGAFASIFVSDSSSDIQSAMRRCIGSAQQRSGMSVQGGVVLQAAIRPAISGVYFSHSPLAHDDDCIEFTRGLSVGINAGYVRPVRCSQRRTAALNPDGVVGLSCADQPVVLLPATAHERELPPADVITVGRGSQAGQAKILAHVPDTNLIAVAGSGLPPLQISDVVTHLRLVRTAGRYIAEHLFQAAVDVEWCIDEGGELWIVQARQALAPQLAAPDTQLEQHTASEAWSGVPASLGSNTGWAMLPRAGFPRSVSDPYILIVDSAEHTDTDLIMNAAGIVSRDMGLLSHTAIVARELGIPCIIDADDAVENIRHGDMISINAGLGLIERLPDQANLCPTGKRPSSVNSLNALSDSNFHAIPVEALESSRNHRCSACIIYADAGGAANLCDRGRTLGVAGVLYPEPADNSFTVHWHGTGATPNFFRLTPRNRVGELILDFYSSDRGLPTMPCQCRSRGSYRSDVISRGIS